MSLLGAQLHDSEMSEIVSNIFVSINYYCILKILPYCYVRISYGNRKEIQTNSVHSHVNRNIGKPTLYRTISASTILKELIRTINIIYLTKPMQD